ncbi:unnamed protein product [Rotaria sp. Silwood2]|nr:unnamed protein product [Rotaria sp. Silwood2]CAF4450179.1 unnamed protein product [Rotaria sp. Silwood2]
MSRHIPRFRNAADTDNLPNLDDLRRQLEQIERNEICANQRNDKTVLLKKKVNELQKQSEEKLSVAALNELRVQENLYNITKRTKEINEIIKKLNEDESIDVCFLMDCTNSMRKYIDQVKQYIFNTVDLLQARFPHLKMRLAFAGYCDLNLSRDKQYSILDFTDVEEFHRFVSVVTCEYGGDACEDVLGGLQKVTEIKWERSVRTLIHIGDAPAHGRRYHDLSDKADNHLTNDSDGSIGYSSIQELIELKVKYFFGRLKPATDKMIQQFRNYAENKMTIEVVDLNKFENLLPFIVESISESISSTKSSLLRELADNDPQDAGASHRLKETNSRDVVFENNEPDWTTVNCIRPKVIKYECNAQLKCTEVAQQWSIKIATNPFSEGALRLAYYGLTKYKDEWEKVVLKEYKRTNRGTNKKDKYLEDLECQTVADYLAHKFNDLPQLREHSIFVKKIKFIMSKLAFVPLVPGKYRNMLMERFIKGSYKKYSNNAGFVELKDPAFTLQAFSHWTYDHTDGNMMIVDLQGILNGDDGKYLLTDPCIHSTDLTRFGRTNLGKPGMKKFFQTHICNIICHALKLKPNEHQPDIKKVEKYDRYFHNKSNRTMLS